MTFLFRNASAYGLSHVVAAPRSAPHLDAGHWFFHGHLAPGGALEVRWSPTEEEHTVQAQDDAGHDQWNFDAVRLAGAAQLDFDGALLRVRYADGSSRDYEGCD